MTPIPNTRAVLALLAAADLRTFADRAGAHARATGAVFVLDEHSAVG